MKVIATADLHYEWREETRGLVRALAAEVCELSAQGCNQPGADAHALAIAGDTFAFDPAILDECLALFETFNGVRMFVAGNHDLWVHEGSSLAVLNETLPAVCARRGFAYLEEGPVVVGSVGFVGTIGWYDYSLRPTDLDVPERFYAAKTGPGYALAMPPWRYLVEPPHEAPTPQQRRIVTQWMDVRHVKLGMTDGAFTQFLAGKLRAHIEAVRGRVESIVAVLHHLPFREAVRSKSAPSWRFGNAFMGAEVFGEVLAAEAKVRVAVYGHSHTEGVVRHGHVVGVNCGSTYRHKQYVVIDTETWDVQYRGA